MITMKLSSFLLAPALLAILIHAEIQIYPRKESLVHDMTLGKSFPVLFTCEASDSSLTVEEMQMKWFNPNEVEITATGGTMFIEDEVDSLKLRIASPTDENTGTYTCRAVINGVEESDSIELKVFKGINFTSPDDQVLINGTDGKVWCRMSQTTLSKKISWYELGADGKSWTRLRQGEKYRMGYSTESGKEGDYLEIKNVRLSDSKTYICNVDLREADQSRALSIVVTVAVPPKFNTPITLSPITPKEGDTLTLSCKAEGIPTPEYMFYKDKKPLLEQRNTDGRFTIENVQRTDEGVYMCDGKNKGGQSNITTNLDIRIPPVIEETSDITQREGTEVRLPCISTGDPVPSMSWRLKGTQVDYLTSSNSPVYVEEVTDDPIVDGNSKLFRRTLYLVIPKLRSKDAAEYVCKADNQFGIAEKTFKIDVTYKPNFDNQVKSVFYGWVGSKTNLTCVANGNPEPVITWYRGNDDLSTTPGFIITMGQSGLPTRAISYLTPMVDTTNEGSVFGEYRCQAANRFETSSQTLQFVKAVEPGEAIINVIASKATEMNLRISPPSEDGGQPVTKYIIMYGPTDSSKDMKRLEINRFPGDDSTEVTLNELTPNTQYSIKVYAINNVGQGAEKKVVEATEDFSKPDPVKVLSSRQGKSARDYLLQWEVPMTGGAPITNYVVEYSVAEEVDTTSEPWQVVRVSSTSQAINVEGESNTKVNLKDLMKETYYKVTISAVNRIGRADDTTFIFKTGSSAGPTGRASYMQASVAGMLLVVVLTAFFASSPVLSQ